MRFGLFIIFLVSVTTSCVQVSRSYSALPPGIWRAELQVTKDDVLPFNFDISYDENDEMIMTIHNAEERLPADNVFFGKNKEYEDTVRIEFDLMDSYIIAEFKENALQGFFYAPNRSDDYRIPFVGYHGQGHRFSTNNAPPKGDLSGKWAATFEIETEDEYPAVGEFVQKTNGLTGTFLTETGDYRYLEGTVQGDKFALSCFDGSHAFLFTGTIQEEDVLTGKFISGVHYETNWVARRDDNAVLEDPYNLTQITTSDNRINFSLENTEGHIVSLDDEEYDGRPKLISLMGTWCPNCLDESKFILDYISKNDTKDLAVMAVAFERYDNKEKALAMIRKYKDRLEVPYDILYGGGDEKDAATESLGFVDEIISFPTLLFVDRTNKVTRVHTGFAGPATSKFESFKESFEQSVNDILQ